MARERLYIVAYDISSPARWRQVYRIMKGYGHWLQLSVFQCRLTKRRKQEMLGRLEKAIRPGEDHVLIMDIGPAETVDVCIESLGKEWRKPERQAIVI